MLKFVSTLVLSVVLSIALMGGLVKAHQTQVEQHTALVEQSWQNMRLSVSMFKGQCSGVVVADGLMLTAAHCYDPELVSVDEVVKMDREKDLLLVKVPLGCPCAPIAGSTPEVDDFLRVVGFPLARSVQYLTEGRVQSPSVGEAPHYMAISAPIVFGNSGGGVFNSRGELVGIVSAVAVYASGFDGIPFIVPHMGLVVNLDTIRAFLER